MTPSHRVWKEAGTLLAALARKQPRLRSKLARGFLNDVLIALSARGIGAAVVTRNGEDFRLIQQQCRSFGLEVI